MHQNVKASEIPSHLYIVFIHRDRQRTRKRYTTTMTMTTSSILPVFRLQFVFLKYVLLLDIDLFCVFAIFQGNEVFQVARKRLHMTFKSFPQTTNTSAALDASIHSLVWMGLLLCHLTSAIHDVWIICVSTRIQLFHVYRDSLICSVPFYFLANRISW